MCLSARRLLLLCLLIVPAAQARQPQEVTQTLREDPATLREDPAHAFPIHVEHLSSVNGLTQNNVSGIVQDRRGFMWFTAAEGLSRYDGSAFRAFHHIPFDSTSLSAGALSTVYEDREGYLWIGTNGEGLNRFDPRTGLVRRYEAVREAKTRLPIAWINAVGEDRAGALWVAIRLGLSRLDRETGLARTYQASLADPATLSNNLVTDFHETEDGLFWVSTQNGLNRFDPATGRAERFFYDPSDVVEPRDLKEPSSRPEHVFTRIYVHPEVPHFVWVGSARGLLRVDTRDAAFVRFFAEPVDGGFFHVTGITPDPIVPTVLWLTTQEHGLIRFDSADRSFIRYADETAPGMRTPGNTLVTAFTDRSGVVWVSNAYYGLYRFDPWGEAFLHYQSRPSEPEAWHSENVFGIEEDAQGGLWIGTRGGGLHRVDRATGEVRHWTHRPGDPSTLSSDELGDLWIDEENRLWIASAGGLNRMDLATGRIRHYRHDPSDASTIGADMIRAILPSRHRPGMLWLATAGGGLNRLDVETGEVFQYRFVNGDETALCQDWLRALHEDEEGRLWVGTSIRGLCMLDPETELFTAYKHDETDPSSLSADLVYSIHERPREPGILWVGTWGGGLNRFDTRTGTFRHFTTEDGLPDNVIYNILEDDAGHLWLSTNRGLSCFDPETEKFVNYGLSHGIQGLEFNSEAAYRSPSGELFFGGPNGVTAFRPGQFYRNRRPPEVALTDVRLNRAARTDDFWWAERLRETDAGPTMTLGHRQNSLTFHYAGLHFKQPEANRYAYLLEGFDEEWVDAGTERSATFTNLDPGSYTFHLRSANSDGVWSGDVVLLSFTIERPFWRTWWFYLFGVGLLVAGVSGLYRLRLDHLKARSERLERLVQERELAVQALRGSEARIRTILDSTADAIITIDEEGTIQTFNKAAQRIFGYVEEEAVGRKIHDLLPTPYGARHPAILAHQLEASEGAEGGQRREVEARRKDGSLFPASLAVSEVHLGDRRLFTSIIQDISEQKASQAELAKYQEHLEELVRARTAQLETQAEQLMELDRLKTRFFANVSHEFRTPLTLIQGPLEFVLRGRYGKLPDGARRHLSQVLGQTHRLQELVEQLLDLVRLRSGKQRLFARPIELGVFLRRVVGMYRPVAEQANLSLDLAEAPGGLYVYADWDKLEKVVTNLLGNAIKFTPAGGRVRIWLDRAAEEDESGTGAFVVLHIQDNGVGIAPQAMPHIFDRFYQADDTSTRSHDGMGIGLALVKELVELHGGRIAVESRIGAGTRFSVHLPLGSDHLTEVELVRTGEQGDGTSAVSSPDPVAEPAAHVSGESPEGEPDAAAGSGPHVVLLVEDNEEMREYLREHLGGRFRVEEAGDGREGLRRARALHPDVIVSDAMMPRLNGYQLLEEVRKDPSLQSVAFVLLSAFVEGNLERPRGAAGADAVLPKPFEMEALEVVVRRLAERRHRASEVARDEDSAGTVAVLRHEAARSAFLEEARGTLLEHVGDPSFGVEALAEQLGLEPGTLARRLSELAGESPAAFIRRVRLEAARRMLLDREVKRLEDVAEAVGFENPAYFARLYRKAFGDAS